MAGGQRTQTTTHHLCDRCAPGASRTLGSKKSKKKKTRATRVAQTRAAG